MLRTSLYILEHSKQPDSLWTYSLDSTSTRIEVGSPIFEIDGLPTRLNVHELRAAGPPTSVGNGIDEHRFEGPVTGQPGIMLAVIVRTAQDTPFVRFRYEVSSEPPRELTKTAGIDSIDYCALDLQGHDEIREVRFSEFNELYHSFCLVEAEIDDRHFADDLRFMGPIVAARGRVDSVLIAYEHGSQLPDRFMEFAPRPGRRMVLRAVKGNYFHGQPIGANVPFRTVWFQLGMVEGDLESLAGSYREFVLSRQSPYTESRKPYIYYNTWNYQERNQDWNKKTYLDSMTATRMLAEIDKAHRMGIDVFVIDTGWYVKTGDWQVNFERFPGGMKQIKDRLDSYAMKLGLWFNPVVAALTSRMRAEHEDCLMTWAGKAQDPQQVWETEESQGMCLASRYNEAFADELIRLYNELGVTYFKWDNISQYGCNDHRHRHGTSANTEAERSECYAFALAGAMVNVVERVCKSCPDAIVNFDITEGRRAVGLSFLSVGKYFLINNGPYYHNYDIPAPPNRNVNMFFFAGPARGWICRAPLNYDRWFPSVLFLTHYFPDDPAENQWITLASLMLGQNGIWGDLLSVSDAGVERIGDCLARYKLVRDDVTKAPSLRSGPIGGSPEVHEKISRQGRGIVSIFASAPGVYTYVTGNRVAAGVWTTEGAHVRIDSDGRAIIEATFDKPSAHIAIFSSVRESGDLAPVSA